jgi:hypothetical protein
MTIYVPGGLIAIFISFYYFREFHRVKRLKHDERRDSQDAVRQAYLDGIIKAKKRESERPDQTT